jgi:hypothetical protein
VIELAGARVVTASSVIALIDNLLSYATDLCESLTSSTLADNAQQQQQQQQLNRSQCRFYCSIVLHALPWLAYHLQTWELSKIQSTLNRLQTLLDRSRSTLVESGFLAAFRISGTLVCWRLDVAVWYGMVLLLLLLLLTLLMMRS